MVQKEPLLFKLNIVILIAIVFLSCNKTKKEEVVSPSSLIVDISKIPCYVISSENKKLKLVNGIVYLNNKVFSGFVKESYNPNQVKSIFCFLNGRQHGETKTFFLNGKLKESRTYKEGKSYGRQYGYWENGHQKFDFIYINDKREGLQKQWYESGGQYAFLNFKNDQEEGMQKAWRENGKPYINYQAKEGHRYGLQKSNLCYTLRDQKIKFSIK